MEANEVSVQAVRVLAVMVGDPDRWFTNAEIAEAATEVAPRTVRAYTLRFVQQGVLDQAKVFPAHRYRLAPIARQGNHGYFERLRIAAEAMGEPLESVQVQPNE